MKIEAEIQSISMTGHSILILRRPNDPEHLPSHQAQMNTEVAKYIKSLIDKDQAES